MITKEESRQEIEQKLKNMGDYVKMDYLSSCMRKKLDSETRRFVMTNLARLYEQRGMFGESGKIYKNTADINPTFQGKIEDFMKSANNFVKSGDYESADGSYKKALASANEVEKNRIKEQMKTIMFNQAKILLQKNKRRNALEVYERIYQSMQLDIQEKSSVKNELLSLYKQLGKIREYSLLSKSNNPVEI